MIIRSAILEGRVAPADRAAFDAHMRDVVAPAIGTYPGLRKLDLRRVAEADSDAPPIYMIFDLWFDDLEAMNAALASETRALVRETIAQGMKPFEGRVYHVVFDSLSAP